MIYNTKLSNDSYLCFLIQILISEPLYFAYYVYNPGTLFCNSEIGKLKYRVTITFKFFANNCCN